MTKIVDQFFKSKRLVVAQLALASYFALLSIFPYYLAERHTPATQRFSGLIVNHIDQSWYLSVHRSIAERLPQTNRSTVEPNAPTLVAPLYFISGFVERITGLPRMVAYHLPRVAGAFGLALAVFWLFSICFPGRPVLSLGAGILALFNLGFGLLTDAHGNLAQVSDDLGVPESNVLMSTLVTPHFVVAQLGQVLAFAGLALAVSGSRKIWVAIAAGSGGLLMAITHPYLLLPFFVSIALVTGYLVVSARKISFPELSALLVTFGSAALTTAPIILMLALNQAEFNRINPIAYPTTPLGPLKYWVLGAGILLPLAAVGLSRLRRGRYQKGLVVLTAWLVAQLPLLFGFTLFQRRFTEGLAFPLAGLAVYGLYRLVRHSPSLVPAVVGGLSVFLMLNSVLVAARVSKTAYYISPDSSAVFNQVGVNDVVLSGQGYSWLLPGQTSGITVPGRGVETINNAAKVALRQEFAAQPNSARARAILHELRVNKILVDEGDTTFLLKEPLTAPCYQLVVNTPTAKLYEVALECR